MCTDHRHHPKYTVYITNKLYIPSKILCKPGGVRIVGTIQSTQFTLCPKLYPPDKIEYLNGMPNRTYPDKYTVYTVHYKSNCTYPLKYTVCSKWIKMYATSKKHCAHCVPNCTYNPKDTLYCVRIILVIQNTCSCTIIGYTADTYKFST